MLLIKIGKHVNGENIKNSDLQEVHNKAKEKLNLWSQSTKCQLFLAEEGGGISDKTLETIFLLFIQLPHSRIEFLSGPDLQQESDIFYLNNWVLEGVK